MLILKCIFECINSTNVSCWFTVATLCATVKVRPVKYHGLPVSLTDFGNLSRLTTGRHNAHSKKATGFDHIPAKLLKVSADIIAPSPTAQINNNIATSCCPTELKTAQVIPVYKKKDPLDKANYRPVSILPALSKIF